MRSNTSQLNDGEPLIEQITAHDTRATTQAKVDTNRFPEGQSEDQTYRRQPVTTIITSQHKLNTVLG